MNASSSKGVNKRADGSFNLNLPTQSSSSNNEFDPSYSDNEPSPSILKKNFLSHNNVNQSQNYVAQNVPSAFSNPHLPT